MKVELVSMTEDSVNKIERAASNCYDSEPSPDGRIMKACYEHGHDSVLEFCQVHFHVEGVSRALLTQITRHRTGHFAVRSQRYVVEDGFEYVTPPRIEINEFCKIRYDNVHRVIREAYETFIKEGVSPEDARFILPNSCTTKMDVSFDMRHFIHFCNLRLCNKAQWEIRELAQRMRDLVVEREPMYANLLVPQCDRLGKCPEHKSCGRHPTSWETQQLITDTKPNKKSLMNTYLILGRSGSGKDTIVDALCQEFDASKVCSYTTRSPRGNETGTHVFISDDEMDKLKNENQLVAYTEFDGNRYGATLNQVQQSDFYIIDPKGLKYFREHTKDHSCMLHDYIVIYIDAPRHTCMERMMMRADSLEDVNRRAEFDDKAFEGVEHEADIVISNVYWAAAFDDLKRFIQELESFNKENQDEICLYCDHSAMDDGAVYCKLNKQ